MQWSVLVCCLFAKQQFIHSQIYNTHIRYNSYLLQTTTLPVLAVLHYTGVAQVNDSLAVPTTNDSVVNFHLGTLATARYQAPCPKRPTNFCFKTLFQDKLADYAGWGDKGGPGCCRRWGKSQNKGLVCLLVPMTVYTTLDDDNEMPILPCAEKTRASFVYRTKNIG